MLPGFEGSFALDAVALFFVADFEAEAGPLVAGDEVLIADGDGEGEMDLVEGLPGVDVGAGIGRNPGANAHSQ